MLFVLHQQPVSSFVAGNKIKWPFKNSKTVSGNFEAIFVQAFEEGVVACRGMRGRATLSKSGRWMPGLLPTKLTPCTRTLDTTLFEEPPELLPDQKAYLLSAALATVYIDISFYTVRSFFCYYQGTNSSS